MAKHPNESELFSQELAHFLVNFRQAERILAKIKESCRECPSCRHEASAANNVSISVRVLTKTVSTSVASVRVAANNPSSFCGKNSGTLMVCRSALMSV